jgi:hypothetical protein
MSQSDAWSPDQSSGDQPFEQSDEALDDSDALDSDFLETVEQDPTLDPALQVDDLELAEAGVEFDDPESKAVLDGGIDDPDGVGSPLGNRRGGGVDDVGWDLDAPVTRGDVDLDGDSI